MDRIGPDEFRAELERRVGRAAEAAGSRRRPACAATTTSASRRRPTASTPRSASACPSAASPPSSFREVVRLAREYGTRDGEIRLTHQQNILIPWVPHERVGRAAAEPLLAELSAEPPLFMRGLQTCTGKEFCGLAKVHTKDRAAEIARFLDTHVAPTGTGRTCGSTSRAARRHAPSTRSPTSASRASSRRSTASSSRRWTSGSGGASARSRSFGDVVIKKVPALGPQRDAPAGAATSTSTPTSADETSRRSPRAPPPSGGRSASSPSSSRPSRWAPPPDGRPRRRGAIRTPRPAPSRSLARRRVRDLPARERPENGRAGPRALVTLAAWTVSWSGPSSRGSPSWW